MLTNTTEYIKRRFYTLCRELMRSIMASTSQVDVQFWSYSLQITHQIVAGIAFQTRERCMPLSPLLCQLCKSFSSTLSIVHFRPKMLKNCPTIVQYFGNTEIDGLCHLVVLQLGSICCNYMGIFFRN